MGRWEQPGVSARPTSGGKESAANPEGARPGGAGRALSYSWSLGRRHDPGLESVTPVLQAGPRVSGRLSDLPGSLRSPGAEPGARARLPRPEPAPFLRPSQSGRKSKPPTRLAFVLTSLLKESLTKAGEYRHFSYLSPLYLNHLESCVGALGPGQGRLTGCLLSHLTALGDAWGRKACLL